MNCDETQELLNSLVDNELPANEAEAVSAHLQHCEKCKHEHRLIADLHNTLTKVARYPLPDSLAMQVMEQIVSLEENQRPRHKWVRWMTQTATHTTAAFFGAAILFGVSRIPDKPPALHDDIIAVHVRSLMAQNLTQVTTGDAHTVKPWFAGKINYAPPVHDLMTEGFPLIGGRVDRMDKRKVAVLVYRRRNHLINLFVEIATANATPAGYTQRYRNGYHVVRVQQDDFVYSAVSDMSADELQKFLQLLLAYI